VYGQSKLEGEKAIIASCSRHIILRTSWVYGRHGQNFIKTILRLASERTSLSVIDDQWGAPTGSELLADVVAQMIPELVSSDNKAGIYHCAASGVTNWHGYARYIVETASSLGQALSIGADAIEAIPASQYKTAAKRPLNSRLDCSSLERTFSLTLPHWQLGVARVISEIASP
jgi:dTDP-4-dehydrorhamnose reductase